MNVLYSLWAVYLFIGLGVTADAFFVPTLTRISGIFLLYDGLYRLRGRQCI